MRRMQQLRARLSVRRAEDEDGIPTHDEVRYVLRPYFGRKETDVRDRLPERRLVLRYARTDRAVATAVATGQQVSVRRTKDHYEGQYDDAESSACRIRRCNGGDGRASRRQRDHVQHP